MKDKKGDDKMGAAKKVEELNVDVEKPITSTHSDDLNTEDEFSSFSPVIAEFALRRNISLTEAAHRLTALDSEPGFIKFVDAIKKILKG